MAALMIRNLNRIKYHGQARLRHNMSRAEFFTAKKDSLVESGGADNEIQKLIDSIEEFTF